METAFYRGKKMNLIYGIKDRPSFGKVVLFALQQLLAIMAATIAVPAIVGNGLSASAALFGAGVGTIVYLLSQKVPVRFFLEAPLLSSGQCSVHSVVRHPFPSVTGD